MSYAATFLNARKLFLAAFEKVKHTSTFDGVVTEEKFKNLIIALDNAIKAGPEAMTKALLAYDDAQLIYLGKIKTQIVKESEDLQEKSKIPFSKFKLAVTGISETYLEALNKKKEGTEEQEEETEEPPPKIENNIINPPEKKKLTPKEEEEELEKFMKQLGAIEKEFDSQRNSHLKIAEEVGKFVNEQHQTVVEDHKTLLQLLARSITFKSKSDQESLGKVITAAEKGAVRTLRAAKIVAERYKTSLEPLFKQRGSLIVTVVKSLGFGGIPEKAKGHVQSKIVEPRAKIFTTATGLTKTALALTKDCEQLGKASVTIYQQIEKIAKGEIALEKIFMDAVNEMANEVAKDCEKIEEKVRKAVVTMKLLKKSADELVDPNLAKVLKDESAEEKRLRTLDSSQQYVNVNTANFSFTLDGIEGQLKSVKKMLSDEKMKLPQDLLKGAPGKVCDMAELRLEKTDKIVGLLLKQGTDVLSQAEKLAK